MFQGGMVESSSNIWAMTCILKTKNGTRQYGTCMKRNGLDLFKNKWSFPYVNFELEG
jgi:hypothetical protein